MTKTSCLALMLIALFAVSATAQDKEKSVLCIGNSFTYYYDS